MLNKTDTNYTKSIPIGKEVAIFRTLLNCTQQKFADQLLLSRISISKLEQTKDLDELTSDIAFRLFYIAQKVIENQKKEDYVKEQARILQSRIDEFYNKRYDDLTLPK